MSRHFCHDVGRHVSDQCFGTPASATTLLLHGQTRFDRCFNTHASATTLLLRGHAHSDRCFGTLVSATTLLLRGQARSDRWHSCFVLRHFNTVQYLRVLIVLCPTHFLLLV